MVSFEVHAEQANVNIEEGKVILVGVDMADIIAEVGNEEVLDSMEFSDVHDYVINRLNEEVDG